MEHSSYPNSSHGSAIVGRNEISCVLKEIRNRNSARPNVIGTVLTNIDCFASQVMIYSFQNCVEFVITGVKIQPVMKLSFIGRVLDVSSQVYVGVRHSCWNIHINLK